MVYLEDSESFTTVTISSGFEFTVSKTTDELQLRWAPENPVMLFENMKLPQFEIENVTVSLCKEKFHIGEYLLKSLVTFTNTTTSSNLKN